MPALKGLITPFFFTDLTEQSVEIGMPVEMVTCKLHKNGSQRGMLVYSYKFRPILANSSSIQD